MGEVFIKTLVGFFISILFFAESTLGFTLIASGIRGYDEDTVTVHLNSNCPSSVSSALDSSIDFWNGAPHSGLVLERGSGANVSIGDVSTGNFSGNIIVYCSNNFAADTGGTDPDVVGGLGGARDLDGDNHLDKGFLIININNSANASFLNASSGVREYLVIHELGHSLGLGHTSERGAIMFFSISGKDDAHLHQDDIDGIRHLYAQDELGGDYLLGCARIRWTPNIKPPTPPWPLIALMLLPVAVLLRLRQQVRS